MNFLQRTHPLSLHSLVGGPSAFAVARDLVKKRGLAGFFVGVGPSLIRAFLVSGSRFSAYEGAMAFLRRKRPSTER